MKLAAAIDVIEQLFEGKPSPLRHYRAEISERYDVRSRWSAQEGSDLCFADDNGVYIFVSAQDDVLRVGKADQESPGGIGRRVCAHLQPYEPEGEVMFPRHEWADDLTLDAGLRRDIACGRFGIVTAKIEPHWMSRFIEKLLNIVSTLLDQRLPLLSKQT